MITAAALPSGQGSGQSALSLREASFTNCVATTACTPIAIGVQVAAAVKNRRCRIDSCPVRKPPRRPCTSSMTTHPTSGPTDPEHAPARVLIAPPVQANDDHGFDAPWTVAVGPSAQLGMAIVAGHAAGLMAVGVAQAPPVLAVALCAAIVGSAVLHLARLARVALPQSIVGMELAGDGRVQVRQRDGRVRRARLLPSTVVGSRLTVVRLRLDGQRCPASCLLLSDNCDTEAFRRLRTGLVWQVGPSLQHRKWLAD